MAAAAFASEGYAVLPGLISADHCDTLISLLADLADLAEGAGSRDLLERDGCRKLAQMLSEHTALAGLLPAGHRAIQCTFFDKSADRNWLVALHQDLSVPVAARVADAGLTGWSVKQEQTFVHAPRPLLNDLVAVRLHLDDCGPDDGPLRVVPATHALGVLTPEAARMERDRRGEVSCCVERGGALAMRPLLLHASSKSTSGRHRRVLHFVYGPEEPGWGLAWPQVASMRC